MAIALIIFSDIPLCHDIIIFIIYFIISSQQVSVILLVDESLTFLDLSVLMHCFLSVPYQP